MKPKNLLSRHGLLAALAGAWMLNAMAVAGVTTPQSPDEVHTALRILASVYADMESKLPGGQYDRLPHENQEFQDGSGAMRDAVAKESPPFKTSVLSALDATTKAAQNVADTSASHDAAKVRAALDALAASMRSLNDLFPESLRAEPGSVPAPQHGGPPPGK